MPITLPGLQSIDSVKVIEIPEPYNPIAIYGFACLTDKALPLADFLVSPVARGILEQHGFMPPVRYSPPVLQLSLDQIS